MRRQLALLAHEPERAAVIIEDGGDVYLDEIQRAILVIVGEALAAGAAGVLAGRLAAANRRWRAATED